MDTRLVEAYLVIWVTLLPILLYWFREFLLVFTGFDLVYWSLLVLSKVDCGTFRKMHNTWKRFLYIPFLVC